MKKLETDRLKLRKVELNDSQQMYDNWCSDDEVAKYVTWYKHENVKNTVDFVNYLVQQYKFNKTYRWIIDLKSNNEVIGMIDVVEYNEGKPELGYLLSRKYWNNGYMSEALISVTNYLFDEGFNKIIIRHDILNPASAKVMIKCGYTKFKTSKSENNRKDGSDCIVDWYYKENSV
jgi:ribosomal-protein-alanine N-acetyltransferase